MNLPNSTQREAVITEARTWLGTRFHHEARVKGGGVDCLMFLAEVYERAGVIPRVKVPHYPPDWHMHRDVEKYLEGVMGFAVEVDEPKPGDVALFKFGRAFSHGTIVIEWPEVIHAYWNRGVVYDRATLFPLVDRDVKFFNPYKNV